MPTNYFYWRDENGKPHRSTGNDVDKYAPQNQLREIGKAAFLDNDGRVSWKNWSNPLLPIVASSVIATSNDELNDADSNALISRAVTAAIKSNGPGKPLPARLLARHANAMAAEFYLKSLQDYELVTSISAKMLAPRSFVIGDCEIKCFDVLPAKYVSPKSFRRHSSNGHIVHRGSTRYTHIVVKTRGRTVNEAVENALGSINILRGCVTLICSYRNWHFRFGVETRKPIGILHLGPVHTLHYPSGEPYEDMHWYEPTYIKDLDCYGPREGWAKVTSSVKLRLRRIAKWKYCPELEDLLIRYADALDCIVYDATFLQLWSILERVTSCIGRDYDKLDKRACWVFQDHYNAREMVQIAKMTRNRYVHSAKSTNQIDQRIYMIKSIVDTHLLNLIDNCYQIDKLQDYGLLLDCGRNEAILMGKRKLLSKGLRHAKIMNSQDSQHNDEQGSSKN